MILVVVFMGYMRTRHRKHFDKVTRDTQGKPSLDDMSPYPTAGEMEETPTGDRLPHGTSARNANPTTGRKSGSGVYTAIVDEHVPAVPSYRATWTGSLLPSGYPVVTGATRDVLESSGETAERDLMGEANVIRERISAKPSPPPSPLPEPPVAGESRETEAELRRQLVAMQAQIKRLIEMQGSRAQAEALGEEPPYDG
ncbi:hypothetical protein JAAARDRAFT_209712 [Jaapia argillacea MUCL 33604]|uniref:Uncharacterized protein n=1 Tax=Jaapia argillacea MUCL 33604 TaxID=933084 RepID=A0A067PJF3_9AGAM|nr:hypothetical protein JAAARDRAFT_209712 [Jaapia argillacea MUCL 33604]